MASEAAPLAEFVRFLIVRWLETAGPDGKRRTLRALKLASGMTERNSMLDQVKKGSTVSEYLGSKICVPLGYRDFPDLVNAAYTWWREGGNEPPATTAEAPLAEAIRLARRYNVTQAQIERGIARVPKESHASLEQLDWLTMFHAEQSLDRRIHGELKAEVRAVQAREKARAGQQREIRELAQEAASPPKRRKSKAS